MKKIFSLLIIVAIVLSMVSVMAQQNKFMKSNTYSESEMKQIQNKFQNRYQFNCTGECNYYTDDREGQMDNLQLEVKTQKKLFNFINVEARENYVFNSDESGEIIRARYNIWSRLLNQDRLRI